MDDYLAAVHKPAGWLVHRTGLDAGETRWMLQAVRAQLGRPVWPVHRLDKGTSGVLLFALSPDAARSLTTVFATGEGVEKTYHAMVRGWPTEDGLIDHPLRRMEDDRPGVRRGDEDTRGAPRTVTQEAQTLYRTLARFELPIAHGFHPSVRAALVELRPLTGRRHQLRRHLKHIAHPILGDATHGKGPLNRAVAECLGLTRLWLHASTLSLTHPVDGRLRVFDAPRGAEWAVWERWRVG